MGVQFTAPNANNHAIGKGVLYVSDFPGAGAASWVSMGNCPSIEIEQTVERLDHYSSQAGTKTKDKSAVIQTDYTINFDCDEISAANLKIFLSADESGTTISAMQDTNKEYALKFVSANPVGPDYVWWFWKCQISSNGAVSLIGDDWMVMSYTAMGLADTSNHSSSPYFDCIRKTTTSTTTSSSTSSTCSTAA